MPFGAAVTADHRSLAHRTRALRSPVLDEEYVQPIFIKQRKGQLRLLHIGATDGRDRRPQQSAAADGLADVVDNSWVVPGRASGVEGRMMDDQHLLAERQSRQPRRQFGEDLRVLEQAEARLESVALDNERRIATIDGCLNERMDRTIA